MKVLYLTIENMNLSKGSAVHVREIVRRLREMDCEVTLVASGNPQAEGVPTFISLTKMSYPEGKFQGVLTMLWRLIRLFFFAHLYLHSHDVAYARDYHVALICTLPKLLLRRKLVYEINGLASEEWSMKGDTILHRAVALIIKASEGLAVKGSNRVVAVTQGLKEYLVSTFGVEERRITVIPNGVDTRVFYPIKDPEILQDLRARLGIQKGAPVVFFAGNLAPWQGLDRLLASAPTVLKHVPRVRFLIVGDGTLRGQLQTRIRTMKLEKHVIMTGMVPHDQIPRYVSLADVCVSPKRNYPTGLSPLKVYEYMACGKAVVSSRVAGLDFIGERETGILVEPENPQALAQGIVALLLDPQERARMGRNGAELARQEFDWQKRAREVLQAVIDTARHK